MLVWWNEELSDTVHRTPRSVSHKKNLAGFAPPRIASYCLRERGAAPADFLKSVDKRRAKQPDEPSRPEAIRRLEELGLKVKPSK